MTTSTISVSLLITTDIPVFIHLNSNMRPLRFSSSLKFKWKISSILKSRCCNLTGGGGEGEYRVFNDFLNQNGIFFRHSCPYTHHQNGLVERKTGKSLFQILVGCYPYSCISYKQTPNNYTEPNLSL